MVRCQDGEEVSVEVAGVIAPDLKVESKTEGNIETITCYIEARDGAEFTVKVRSLPVVSKGPCHLLLYVDGKYVSKSIQGCDPTHWNTSKNFVGFRSRSTSHGRDLHAFTFGKIATTNGPSAPKLSKKELEEICSIRLEIHPLRRNGKKYHIIEATDYNMELPRADVLHEDSKPALWGLNTVPGRKMFKPVGPHCRCDYEDDTSRMRKVVVFRYRSQEWLRAQGIQEERRQEPIIRIPLPDDSDGIFLPRRSATYLVSQGRSRPSGAAENQNLPCILGRAPPRIGRDVMNRPIARASQTSSALEIQRAVAEALERGRRQGREEAEAETRLSLRRVPAERAASVKSETNIRRSGRRFETVDLTLEDGQLSPRRSTLLEAIVIED